ncbi:hypothetical protein [Rhodoferax sp. BLA1]|uniref:hypothetical protein n=1 Tax=Rhodoferax sp. BLA1 TaxID=2576062 RepID=UPI0015D279E8|nr:hypothetical protein [Rhodoferax sp. BLA1]
MSTVSRTHPRQSQDTLDLLNFVNARQSVTYAELFDQFRDDGHEGDNDADTHRRFGTRMAHLLEKGQLACTGRGRSRMFTLGPDAVDQPASAAGVERNQKKKPAAKACSSAPLAPLPYLNLSRLPATVLPSRSPVLRPGALDFQRVASRGFAC